MLMKLMIILQTVLWYGSMSHGKIVQRPKYEATFCISWYCNLAQIMGRPGFQIYSAVFTLKTVRLKKKSIKKSHIYIFAGKGHILELILLS